MVKVLSIDPGIVNLSFCFLEDENILFWENINLLSEETNQKNNSQCDQIFVKGPKKGKRCSLKIKYKDEQKNSFFCSRHKTNNCTSLKPTINSNNVSFQFLANSIYKKLDFLKDNFVGINNIVIENQKKSNEKVKFVASCIFSYLALLFPKSEIIFIPAKFKLQVYKGPVCWNIEDEPKQRYKRNKFLALQHCKSLIPEKWECHFNLYPKKDDLSDCFLAGLYFIKNGYRLTYTKKKSRYKKKNNS